MKLSKFLTAIFITTLFSLLYVYQQTEIFRFAYLGEKKQALFQDLLDNNNILRYNVNKNASLVQIGNSVLECVDYEMPKAYRLVSLVPSEDSLRLKRDSLNKETVLSKLFGIKRQAEAETINP
jgi:hypothetical protein